MTVGLELPSYTSGRAQEMAKHRKWQSTSSGKKQQVRENRKWLDCWTRDPNSFWLKSWLGSKSFEALAITPIHSLRSIVK